MKKSLKIQKNKIETEEERLRRDIYRSDLEKFQLFTRMLRRNELFKKAVIKHK